MIEPGEKSTEVPRGDWAAGAAGREAIDDDLLLDGMLALYHRSQRWHAAADLHFGYEMSRRRAGGLWPLWGMEAVEERLRSLVLDCQPETLVLVGDVVDSSAAVEKAVEWLSHLQDLCVNLVLIEGNHDRGPIKERFDFVPSFQSKGFLFHHGHLGTPATAASSVAFPKLSDICILRSVFGTGRERPSFCPVFVMEEQAEPFTRKAVLPAFSPWAGGRYSRTDSGLQVRQWACGHQRVFEVT